MPPAMTVDQLRLPVDLMIIDLFNVVVEKERKIEEHVNDNTVPC